MRMAGSLFARQEPVYKRTAFKNCRSDSQCEIFLQNKPWKSRVPIFQRYIQRWYPSHAAKLLFSPGFEFLAQSSGRQKWAIRCLHLVISFLSANGAWCANAWGTDTLSLAGRMVYADAGRCHLTLAGKKISAYGSKPGNKFVSKLFHSNIL